MIFSQQPAASSQQPAASSQQPAASAIIAPCMDIYENWQRECRCIVKSLCAHFPKSSKEDAEEALEAAIEFLLKKDLIFEEIEERSAWLFVTAGNYLSNYRRKCGRLTTLDATNDLSIEDEMVQVYENRDRVDNVLKIIDENDRELLRERFEDGKSIREIAIERGMTVSKLETRSKRAIKKIRKYFNVP